MFYLQGSKRTSIKALLWSPITACQNKCPGCYLSGTAAEAVEQGVLCKSMEMDALRAEQITIAIQGGMKVPWNTVRWLAGYMGGGGVDVHLTLHSPDEWTLPPEKTTPAMVSVSTMDIRNFTPIPKWNEKCVSNFNCLVDGRDRMDDIEAALKRFDQVYLILQKNPLGNALPNRALDWYTFHLWKLSKLPEEQRSRIYIDTCVINSWKHMVTGLCCDAGCSVFHLWGKDTLTSCPYDTQLLQVATGNTLTLSEKVRHLRFLPSPMKEHCKVVTEFADQWHSINNEKLKIVDLFKRAVQTGHL